VNLSVTEPGKDVLITVERERVRRFFVASVPGYASTVYIPTYNSDLPNVFVSASTFLTKGYLFNNSSEEISLLKDSKEINVSITPNSEKYAPGDTAELSIKTTGSSGNPLSAEVAVWVVDKSLYELMSDQRISIMDAFWSKRYNATNYKNSFEGIVSYGAEKGCFIGDTKVLTPSGLRQIKDIKAGDYVLTRKSESDQALVEAKVKNVHSISTNGYLILNGNIKVTAEHMMWVNNNWKDAGDIQVGDYLLDKDGKERQKLGNQIADGEEVTLEIKVKESDGKIVLHINVYHSKFQNVEPFDYVFTPNAINIQAPQPRNFRVGLNDFRFKGTGSVLDLKTLSVDERE